MAQNNRNRGRNGSRRRDAYYADDLYEDNFYEEGGYSGGYEEDPYYDEEFEEQLRRREARRRKAKAAQMRRREREKKLRRIRILTVLVSVFLIIFIAAIVLTIRGGGVIGTSESEVAVVADSAALHGEEPAEEESSEDDPFAIAGQNPTEEEIAAARAAKNYSAEVANLWPFNFFTMTENTVTIPTVPGYEEEFYLSFGSEFGSYEVPATQSETGVAEDTAEAETSESGASESEADDAADESEASGEDTEGDLTEDTAENTSAEIDLGGENEGVAVSDSAETSVNADGTITVRDGQTIPVSASVGGDYVGSKYALVVNADTGEIVAEKNAFEKIVPASMTKVMTVLVAAEMLESEDSLKDMVTLTEEDESYAYVNGSSAVCWMPGDTATVEDLFYGTILPSGADAAVALAEYIAGSHEEFVKLMNDKAEELGISETTHFTNCVGVYDDDHYSTIYDIAIIMRAAMENDFVRKVCAEHTWTTSPTSVHPEGITVSNWFLRRIEDRDNNGEVLCAKTGFVNESGSCAVSFQIAEDGTHYIACTANAVSGWRCIYDHSALYREYTSK